MNANMTLIIDGFADRLRYAFYKSGWSIEDMKERTGISRSNFNSYLSGDMLPAIKNLTKICLVLNVSADYLIFGRDQTCNTLF